MTDEEKVFYNAGGGITITNHTFRQDDETCIYMNVREAIELIDHLIAAIDNGMAIEKKEREGKKPWQAVLTKLS